MKRSSRIYFLLTVAIFLACPGLSNAQAEKLGDVIFPTSARSQEAQGHFLRGVKYLHSFGFEEALEAFQAANKIEPDFVLAYWGETLSSNDPLQIERDAESPRKALARLGATPAARIAMASTDLEKGFLTAVEIRFGEGSASERVFAYAEAMERLVAQYPEVTEARAFYSIALLGTVPYISSTWGAESTYIVRIKAGALALEIFNEYPNHPGAAHYITHAFDDPIHAPLALKAAKRYARIAPDAAHALHMPSHIFIQHGMWPEVVASNIDSYQAANNLWQQRSGFTDSKRFFNDIRVFHALDWREYAYLQQGDYASARKDIDLVRPVVEMTKVPFMKTGTGHMTARYIIETEQWEKHPVTADTPPAEMFATGMSAIKTGDMATAKQVESRLKALHEEKQDEPITAIFYNEILALIHLKDGQTDEALSRIKTAAEIEVSMGLPSGPVNPIKPAHELYGEILLELNQSEEAAIQFKVSLQRTPNRTRSLLGLARASKDNDRKTARQCYEALLANWKSQTDSPALQEAKRFLSESE